VRSKRCTPQVHFFVSGEHAKLRKSSPAWRGHWSQTTSASARPPLVAHVSARVQERAEGSPAEGWYLFCFGEKCVRVRFRGNAGRIGSAYPAQQRVATGSADSMPAAPVSWKHGLSNVF
jgi:hypothetical protein